MMADAKSFLRQVKICDAHINSKLEELAHLRDLSVKITSTLKQDVVSSGGSQDKISDSVAKIIDLENEINKAIDEFVDKKREVSKVIEQITEAEYLTILYKHYFYPYDTFEQIACDQCYTYRHVTRMHGYALKEVEKLLKKEKMS